MTCKACTCETSSTKERLNWMTYIFQLLFLGTFIINFSFSYYLTVHFCFWPCVPHNKEKKFFLKYSLLIAKNLLNPHIHTWCQMAKGKPMNWVIQKSYDDSSFFLQASKLYLLVQRRHFRIGPIGFSGTFKDTSDKNFHALSKSMQWNHWKVYIGSTRAFICFSFAP